VQTGTGTCTFDGAQVRAQEFTFVKGSGSERRYLRPRGIAAATKTASAPTETVWALSSSIWADRQKEGQCKAFFAAEKFIGKCFIVRLFTRQCYGGSCISLTNPGAPVMFVRSNPPKCMFGLSLLIVPFCSDRLEYVSMWDTGHSARREGGGGCGRRCYRCRCRRAHAKGSARCGRDAGVETKLPDDNEYVSPLRLPREECQVRK